MNIVKILLSYLILGAASKVNMEYPQKGYIYVQRYLTVN